MNIFILKIEKRKGPFTLYFFLSFSVGRDFVKKKKIQLEHQRYNFLKHFSVFIFHIFAQIHPLYNNSECYKGNRSNPCEVIKHF